MIIISELKLGYQNVPKIATTSWFDWLYTILKGGDVEEEMSKRRYFVRYTGKGVAADGVAGVIVDNKVEKMRDYEGFYRFAVTRDPVKRFLSMYSNRVVHHRELSGGHKTAEHIRAAGLMFNPQVNDLVADFDRYLAVSSPIRHHALPMMAFLGPDLSVYSRIVDIADMQVVQADILGHWQAQGFDQWVVRAPASLPRKQTGGPKLPLNALTPDSFERLLDYYQEDYAQIPTVSLAAIKEEYLKASQDGVAPPVVFEPRPGKPATTGGKRPVPAPAKASPPASPFLVRYEPAAAVAEIRVTVQEQHGAYELKGFVLLAQETSPDASLRLETGGGEVDVKWGIASPQLAARHPGNARAASSRLKLPRLPADRLAEARLVLISADGSRQVLAYIERWR